MSGQTALAETNEKSSCLDAGRLHYTTSRGSLSQHVELFFKTQNIPLIVSFLQHFLSVGSPVTNCRFTDQQSSLCSQEIYDYSFFIRRKEWAEQQQQHGLTIKIVLKEGSCFRHCVADEDKVPLYFVHFLLHGFSLAFWIWFQTIHVKFPYSHDKTRWAKHNKTNTAPHTKCQLRKESVSSGKGFLQKKKKKFVTMSTMQTIPSLSNHSFKKTPDSIRSWQQSGNKNLAPHEKRTQRVTQAMRRISTRWLTTGTWWLDPRKDGRHKKKRK